MAHSSNSTKVAAAEYVKRKLEFCGLSITRSETESNQASPTLEKAKRRRLYFGESEVPVFLQCLGEFTIVLYQMVTLYLTANYSNFFGVFTRQTENSFQLRREIRERTKYTHATRAKIFVQQGLSSTQKKCATSLYAFC